MAKGVLGRLLKWVVPYIKEGQVCYVHFTRDIVCRYMNIPASGWVHAKYCKNL